MSLPKTTGLLFLVGIAVLALTVFQALSIPEKRQSTRAAESGLLALQQKNEDLSEVLSEAKTIEDNLAVVRQALPMAEDVPVLLMQLEQVAKQSGVSVQHLGFGEGKALTTAAAEEGKVALTAVVTGSYGSLEAFFRNLEGASRVVNVTNFRFSPSQSKEGEAAISVTLGVEAFYLAEVESVPADAPLTLDINSKDYIDLIREVKALRVYGAENF